MINQVTLLGNVGGDPEIRHMQNGDPVASFSIATSEVWKDKDSGERRERTEWHKVVCYNSALCDVIENHVVKGSRIYIQGKLTTRKWTDKEGTDRYTTEVVLDRIGAVLKLLGDPQGARRDDRRDDRTTRDGPAPDTKTSARGNGNGNARTGNGSTRNGRVYVPPADLDDEIPF